MHSRPNLRKTLQLRHAYIRSDKHTNAVEGTADILTGAPVFETMALRHQLGYSCTDLCPSNHKPCERLTANQADKQYERTRAIAYSTALQRSQPGHHLQAC